MVRDTTLIIIIAFAIFTAIFAIVRPGRHYFKLKAAKRVYAKIQAIDDAAVIPYLRKVDPYVFEELVLYAFRKRGYRVYRNVRYSGDGGVDGRVMVNGRRILVQDKRYSGYIQMAHVRDFEDLCRRRRRYGIFVHTGKTGRRAKEIASLSERITIISGHRLVKLLKETENEI